MGRRGRLWILVLLGFVLVVSAVGVVLVIWLSSKPVDAAQIIGTLLALAVMVATGCAALWRWSRAGIAARNSASARLVPGAYRGRLPKLGHVDLTYLGVRVPRESSRASREQLAYAPRHNLDPELLAALRERRFVLVHGPSASGKSRSTAEAARALYSNRPVLAPVDRAGALTELLDAGLVKDGTVVWLDDLDRHIGAGVDAAVLRRLLAIDEVIVVGTIRAAAYEQLKPQGELRPPGRDVVELAILHRGLIEFTSWDAADREHAAQLYVEEPEVVAALDNGMGLGEYLAAGPELVERVETGHPPADGVAVVRAAADWYRAGLSRPAPLHLVQKLYPLYLPPDDATLLDRFEPALQWACTAVSGARLVTHRTDGSGLVVHDYYLDHVSKRSVGTIPSKTWDAIAEELADSPEDLVVVGFAQYDRGDPLEAERWFRAAADAGDTGAMFNLGYVVAERGDLVAAEQWYRAAADAGHVRAMNNLGFLLAARNDVLKEREGMRLLHAAAAAGHTAAMFNLGVRLYRKDDLAGAERWFHAAVEAGDTSAMIPLADVLLKRGELPKAMRWYRAAADAGHVNAMPNLAALLKPPGPDDRS